MAATPPPGYTPPPADLPQRGDRATFSDRVDAWVTWFSTVILTQLAAMIANAYANALDAAASATSALGYRDAAQTARDAAIAARDLAQGYRDTALTYRNGAEAARDAAQGYRDQASATATAIDKRYLGAKAAAPTLDNQGAALTAGAWYFDTVLNRQRVWNGTTWVDGLYGTSGVTTLNGQVGVLTLKTINGTDLVGTGDIITRTTAPVEVRTSNAQIVGADRGKWLRLSGTFAQTFATAAVLTDGWTCFITNSGTGEITMPDVDGWGGTWKMYPGETRLFISDGTSLRTIIIESFRFFSQISGTFAKAPGYRYFDTALSGGGGAGSGGGGGGSGAGAFTIGVGGSGGSGGASGRTAPIVRARLKASVLPASIAFVLGAGGMGGAKGIGGAGNSSAGNNGTSGAVGGVGGASTFGSTAAPASYLTVGGGLNASTVGTGGRGPQAPSPAAGQPGATALPEDTTTSLVWTGATQYPVPAGSAGFASANSPASTATYGAASAGGNGATSAESSFASLTAATVGGVAPAAAAASIGVAGGNGSVAPQAGPGAGGAGGAGGSGSVGAGTAVAAATGKGGDGSNGGNGGDGFVEIIGVI